MQSSFVTHHHASSHLSSLSSSMDPIHGQSVLLSSSSLVCPRSRLYTGTVYVGSTVAAGGKRSARTISGTSFFSHILDDGELSPLNSLPNTVFQQPYPTATTATTTNIPFIIYHFRVLEVIKHENDTSTRCSMAVPHFHGVGLSDNDDDNGQSKRCRCYCRRHVVVEPPRQKTNRIHLPQFHIQ